MNLKFLSKILGWSNQNETMDADWTTRFESFGNKMSPLLNKKILNGFNEKHLPAIIRLKDGKIYERYLEAFIKNIQPKNWFMCILNPIDTFLLSCPRGDKILYMVCLAFLNYVVLYQIFCEIF